MSPFYSWKRVRRGWRQLRDGSPKRDGNPALAGCGVRRRGMFTASARAETPLMAGMTQLQAPVETYVRPFSDTHQGYAGCYCCFFVKNVKLFFKRQLKFIWELIRLHKYDHAAIVMMSS